MGQRPGGGGFLSGSGRLSSSAIKSVAFGFVRNTDAYLRDGWDQLDFFIVVVSVVTLPGA